MKRKNWTTTEINIALRAYFYILNEEQNGRKVNKAAVRRAALKEMGFTRSAGSYEMKLCNISAACVARGLPWVNGYKPLGNGQAALGIEIERQLAAVKKQAA